MSLKTYPNGLRLSIIPKQDAKLISVDLHITSGTQSEKNYESGNPTAHNCYGLLGKLGASTQV